MLIAFKHVAGAPDLADKLITAWTASDWVHCEMLLEYPRQLAISARPTTGVTAKTWEEVLTSLSMSAQGLATPDVWELYQVPVSSEEAVWSFLLGQLGKPYNWAGLVAGHVVGATGIPTPGWFCSELTYVTLGQTAQIDLPLREPAHVSPALLRQYLRQAGCLSYVVNGINSQAA